MASKRRVNRNPGDEKRRDLKRVRAEYEAYLDANWFKGKRLNGVPTMERFYDENPPLMKNGVILDDDVTPDYVGRGRRRGIKQDRKRNGQKEWMGRDGDAWGKPDIHDKSSRRRMRELKEMWEEKE